MNYRPDSSSRQWITIGEAGQLLGLSAGRVRQLIRANRLPAVQTSWGRFLPALAVRAMASARRQQAEPIDEEVMP